PRVQMPNVLTTHPTLMLDLDFIPFDNSLPESKIFYFDIKEKNSGCTTIHADISLLDFECFNFKPDPGELTSIVDFGIRENVPSATNVNLPPEKDHSPLFAYFVWIFLSFLTYPVVPPNLLSFGNEDIIFDPGIANYHFPLLLPDVSHRCETFMKFSVYPKLLNESLMEILSSSCSPEVYPVKDVASLVSRVSNTKSEKGGEETIRGGDVGGFKKPFGKSDVDVVGDLGMKPIKDEEVSLVDGDLVGALGALEALEMEALLDAMDVDNS
nr:hypothetical protein [Tanacetum cinerariifolium]